MKKFQVEVQQEGYRSGFYFIEAPDEDAAYVLAQDKRFKDVHIEWDTFQPYMGDYPKVSNIQVTEVKE